MLGVNQLDFINYANALKGNYRKGVHKMETLLENPTHAKEFAKNLGGVSVVLGTPVGKEDRNSETLRSMLLASDVANDAVYTWMGQYYEFDSWDELLGDEDRCKAMMANELLWRALSASGVAMGKTVATLAGLSCSAYDDMSAVAASSTARAAIEKSQVAKDAIAASDMATAKYAVGAAGLKPADYANMAAVAASQTAMAAVINNSTALNAVVSSSTAMAAVASSQTAMAAIATSSTAMSAISASTTAINALKASPLLVAKTKSGNNWTTETVRSGRGIAVYIYGASVSGGNGWVKTDNVQTTFSSNGTNQNLLKAFQTSLSVYWYQNSSTLYYIPC